MVTQRIEQTKVAYPGLGAKLREARNKTGLSQVVVGERVGISWMTVHRQEKDDRAVRYPVLVKLADVYGVNVRAFIPAAAAEEPDLAITISIRAEERFKLGQFVRIKNGDAQAKVIELGPDRAELSMVKIDWGNGFPTWWIRQYALTPAEYPDHDPIKST